MRTKGEEMEANGDALVGSLTSFFEIAGRIVVSAGTSYSLGSPARIRFFDLLFMRAVYQLYPQ
jgi:hypothetical protein